MFGLEALIVPLSVEIGKKVINSLWPDEWSRSTTSTRSRRAASGIYQLNDFVSSDNFSSSYPRNVLKLTQYFETTLSVDSRHLGCFLLLVNERDGSAVFGEIGIDKPCEIQLPDGIYSAYTFLLDRAAKHIEDSAIYGLGIPIAADVGDATEIQYDPENVLDQLMDAPVEIWGGRIFRLELLVVSPQDNSSLPQYFSDLFVDSSGKMTGAWTIQGNAETGSSQSEAQLVQVGDDVHGLVVTHWVARDGDEWVVQQFVRGNLYRERLQMEAYDIRVLLGPDDIDPTYELDSWEGVFETPHRIRGFSWDASGPQQVFVMERI